MAKQTILIVDDEAALVDILTDEFVRAGFAVIAASDGQEGLDKALAEHPDLILLDIIMPKMDGLSMLKKLRTDPVGKTIPVIALTNLSDIETAADVLESGGYDLLVKSNWVPRDLVQRVKSKLQDPA